MDAQRAILGCLPHAWLSEASPSQVRADRIAHGSTRGNRSVLQMSYAWLDLIQIKARGKIYNLSNDLRGCPPLLDDLNHGADNLIPVCTGRTIIEIKDRTHPIPIQAFLVRR